MYNKQKKKRRLKPVRKLDVQGKNILDIGSGDCYISKYLLDEGATKADCFDCGEFEIIPSITGLNFYNYGITSWTKFERENKHILLPKYDIVLFLGIFHHLDLKYREKIFKELINRTREYFCFRARRNLFNIMIKQIPTNFTKENKFVWKKNS